MEAEKQKICAVICEFNPFHNGHKHLVSEINRLLPDCRLVAAMSGDFVQRAEPAIFDKYFRTEVALKNGFSAVIRLPAVFSLSSAELFARGGVFAAKAADASALAFGAETDDTALLHNIATLHLEPTKKFSDTLKSLLDDGAPYAAAVSKATQVSLGDIAADALSKPNNILAIEYLKAIAKYAENIKPILIKRNGNDYNDETLSGIPSASALRKALREGKNIKGYLPEATDKNSNYEIYENTAVAFLKLAQKEQIAAAPDCAEGLEYKLKENALKYNNLDDIILATKTKRYTYARIKRIIAQALLGITKETLSEKEFPAKVLGFRKGEIIGRFSHPIYIKNSEYKGNALASIKIDEKAEQLASLCLKERGNPLSKKPVII